MVCVRALFDIRAFSANELSREKEGEKAAFRLSFSRIKNTPTKESFISEIQSLSLCGGRQRRRCETTRNNKETDEETNNCGGSSPFCIFLFRAGVAPHLRFFLRFSFSSFFLRARRFSILSRAFGVVCPTGRSKDGLLLGEKNMAKKGRAARILNTLHKVNGTKQSEALKRRERKRPSKEFGNFAGETNTTLTTNGKLSEWKKKKQKQRDMNEAKEPHDGAMHALVFGDGDFSFSVALVTIANGDGGNLVCTGLEKNVDEKTKDLVECLLDSGARVAHGVDVSKRFDEDVGAGLFESNSSNSNKKKKMDRVYFNFPDCGFGAMASLAPTRIANERLLEHLFERSSEHLKVKGELRVTCFDDAYAAAIPTEACEKLAFVKEKERFRLKAKVPFVWREFPGYEYKKNTRDDDDDEETEMRAAELKEEARRHSFDDAESKKATTLVFEYLGNN